jgi:hypothetical protein
MDQDTYQILKNNNIKYFFTAGYASYLKGVRNTYYDKDVCIRRADMDKLAIALKAKVAHKKLPSGITIEVIEHNDYEFAIYDNFLNSNGKKISFGFNTDVTKHLEHFWDGEMIYPIISMEHLVVLKIFLATQYQQKDDLQDAIDIMNKRKVNHFLILRIAQQRDIMEEVSKFIREKVTILPPMISYLFK